MPQPVNSPTECHNAAVIARAAHEVKPLRNVTSAHHCRREEFENASVVLSRGQLFSDRFRSRAGSGTRRGAAAGARGHLRLTCIFTRGISIIASPRGGIIGHEISRKSAPALGQASASPIRGTTCSTPTTTRWTSRGSRPGGSTSASTASTATSRRSPRRPRSSGPADQPGVVPPHHVPRADTDPSAAWRTCCWPTASGEAIGSASTWRTIPESSPTPCSRARGSAPCTRSCSAASAPSRCPRPDRGRALPHGRDGEEGLRGSAAHPAQEDRGQGDRGHVARRDRAAGGAPHRQRDRHAERARHLARGGGARKQRSPPAPTSGWAPRTRSSSSTPRAAPASRRACLHTTGGYLVYAASTHKNVFDYHQGQTSTSALPTSAGSPATATSSTARSPTAPRP